MRDESAFDWRRAEKDMAGEIDSTVPHSARVWDYWLGGKDYYEADQEAGDEALVRFPGITETVRQLRAFTASTVRYLTAETGVRQFLDIGAGLPSRDPVHEVAQRAAPECHVVYADNDPLTAAYGRALLTSRPPGSSTCIGADLSDPAGLLSAAGRAGLDFTRPAAVLLMSVLGHIGNPARDDDRAAQSVVAELRAALPAGSWLAIGDLAGTSPGLRAAMASYNATGAAPYHLRSPAQLDRFLAGLDPAGPAPGPPPRPAWGGLGRKP